MPSAPDFRNLSPNLPSPALPSPIGYGTAGPTATSNNFAPMDGMRESVMSSNGKRRYPVDDQQGRPIPTASGSGMPGPGSEEEGERETSEGLNEKGGNGRYLKQSKRAAQNRAAQQAFRKRKEERVRELEDKEKLLDSYIERDLELARRERGLAEREKRLAEAASGLSSDTAAAILAGPSSPLFASLPDSLADASGPLTPSDALDALEQYLKKAVTESDTEETADSRKAFQRLLQGIDAARTEMVNEKKMHKESRALVGTLRLSLEDLGAENQALRTTIARHGLNVDEEKEKAEA